MNGFTEITVGDGIHEVMIDIDLSTGKIISVYTYVDSIPEVYSYNERTQEEKQRPCRTYDTKNSLFKRLHLGDAKKAMSYGFVALLEEDVDQIVIDSLSEHFPSIEISQ